MQQRLVNNDFGLRSLRFSVFSLRAQAPCFSVLQPRSPWVHTFCFFCGDSAHNWSLPLDQTARLISVSILECSTPYFLTLPTTPINANCCNTHHTWHSFLQYSLMLNIASLPNQSFGSKEGFSCLLQIAAGKDKRHHWGSQSCNIVLFLYL